MYLKDREEQKDNPDLEYRWQNSKLFLQCHFIVFNLTTNDIVQIISETVLTSDNDLIITITDFFIAGSDTTAATLKWLFLYMAKYSNIQQKIQKEIDSVVPNDRLPRLEDRERLV